MDGNGRWARARGKPRTEGHVAGVKALRRWSSSASAIGVGHLTVFSFSSENWTRPRDEVSFIFGLLHRFVASDLENLHRNNVRVRIIGAREGLDEMPAAPDRGRRDEHRDEHRAQTSSSPSTTAARPRSSKPTRRIAEQVAAGRLQPDEIDETTIERILYTSGMPDPDIIIRTSGEQRFSNFLLWQGAYSELAFVEENWPDFDEAAVPPRAGGLYRAGSAASAGSRRGL